MNSGKNVIVAFYDMTHKIIENKEKGMEQTVSRRLIIDGNAVYEIDEKCMLKNRLNVRDSGQDPDREEEQDRETKKEDNR